MLGLNMFEFFSTMLSSLPAQEDVAWAHMGIYTRRAIHCSIPQNARGPTNKS